MSTDGVSGKLRRNCQANFADVLRCSYLLLTFYLLYSAIIADISGEIGLTHILVRHILHYTQWRGL